MIRSLDWRASEIHRNLTRLLPRTRVDLRIQQCDEGPLLHRPTV